MICGLLSAWRSAFRADRSDEFVRQLVADRFGTIDGGGGKFRILGRVRRFDLLRRQPTVRVRKRKPRARGISRPKFHRDPQSILLIY